MLASSKGVSSSSSSSSLLFIPFATMSLIAPYLQKIAWLRIEELERRHLLFFLLQNPGRGLPDRPESKDPHHSVVDSNILGNLEAGVKGKREHERDSERAMEVYIKRERNTCEPRPPWWRARLQCSLQSRDWAPYHWIRHRQSSLSTCAFSPSKHKITSWCTVLLTRTYNLRLILSQGNMFCTSIPIIPSNILDAYCVSPIFPKLIPPLIKHLISPLP